MATYHRGAPVGHHSSGGGSRAHLRGHVVEAGVGGAGAGQLAVHARVGHHAKRGGVRAGHRQGRPKACRCKEEQAARDSTVRSGPAWPAIPGSLSVPLRRRRKSTGWGGGEWVVIAYNAYTGSLLPQD